MYVISIRGKSQQYDAADIAATPETVEQRSREFAEQWCRSAGSPFAFYETHSRTERGVAARGAVSFDPTLPYSVCADGRCHDFKRRADAEEFSRLCIIRGISHSLNFSPERLALEAKTS